MKRQIFCGLLGSLIGLPELAFSADPFAPPEKVQLLYQIVYPNEGEVLPRYKMLVVRSGASYALLDDTFVKAGDTYKGMIVNKINDKGVLLTTPEGEKRVLVLDALQSNLIKFRQAVKEGEGV